MSGACDFLHQMVHGAGFDQPRGAQFAPNGRGVKQQKLELTVSKRQ